MQVKSIDEFQMKKLLKDCPKEIQQYVKALKSFIDNSSNLRDKQTKKIKEQANEIEMLKGRLSIYDSK